MKTKNLLLVCAAALLPLICQAQTNLTAVPNLIPTNGWGTAVSEDLAFLENVPVTNAIVQIEAGALRGQTTHQIGGFVNVMLPVGGTNSLFGAGVGVAYYNHNFYNATLNARLGDTISTPFVHVPVYVYVESGGGYDISQNKAIAQAFSGATITYNISSKWTITGGIAVGTVSDLNELVEAFGGSITYHFQ
jgi:hypothetical protein